MTTIYNLIMSEDTAVQTVLVGIYLSKVVPSACSKQFILVQRLVTN